MESFWARMQVGLLDRRRWRTRIELANAIFEYLEIFHNRQRRHTATTDAHPDRIRENTLRQHNHHTTNPSELTPQNPVTIKMWSADVHDFVVGHPVSTGPIVDSVNGSVFLHSAHLSVGDGFPVVGAGLLPGG